MFRLTVNGPLLNRNADLLGDRELAGLVGSGNGGVYAFATYSFTDLSGNGSPNMN